MPRYKDLLYRVVGSFPVTEVVTVAFLTDRQGNLLLTRESSDSYWRLPGDSQELEEDLFSCLQRTVLFQTGILIDAANLIRVFSDVSQRYVDRNNAHIFPIYHAFIATEMRGKLEGAEGSTRKFRFFSAANIPFDRVFPPMMPALRFFVENFGDGIPVQLMDWEQYVRYERSGGLGPS